MANPKTAYWIRHLLGATTGMGAGLAVAATTVRAEKEGSFRDLYMWTLLGGVAGYAVAHTVGHP